MVRLLIKKKLTKKAFPTYSVTSDEIADNGESNDEKISFKGIRMKNLRGLIIAYLNINSLRNKFESLKFLIGTNVDVLVIAETKLNGTFPTAQFFLLKVSRNPSDMIVMNTVADCAKHKERICVLLSISLLR